MSTLGEDFQNLLARARRLDACKPSGYTPNKDRVHRMMRCMRRLGDQADNLHEYERKWVMKEADANKEELSRKERLRQIIKEYQDKTPAQQQVFKQELQEFLDSLNRGE